MCPEMKTSKNKVPYDREFFFNVVNTIKKGSINNAIT